VEVWLARPSADLKGVPAHQLQALRHLGVAIHEPDEPPFFGTPEIIIDALIGYRLAGEPSGAMRTLIDAANANDAPTLSLDLPSGLDATTGRISRTCIRATATLTLALPKLGLWTPGAHNVTGELYLGDIAVPDAVYARIGLDPGPIFAKTDILRIG
jgi:NAD(P)H-hydrate epimerase